MNKVETQLERVRNIITSNIKHFQYENPLEFETYNFKDNHQGRFFSEYHFDVAPNKHYKITCISYGTIIIKFDTTEQGTWMLELNSTQPNYKFKSNRIFEPISPIDSNFFKVLDEVLGLVNAEPGYIGDFKLVNKTISKSKMNTIVSWLPEINDNILINISKTIKETLENDPLLFVPRPVWQIMNTNRFQKVSIQMLFIYISQDHQLDILCRRVKNKIDALQIAETKYKNGELLYSALAATIDLESKLIKLTYKDSEPMRECNIELMKILEKLNLVKLDQE